MKNNLYLYGELDRRLLSRIRDLYSNASEEEVARNRPFHWGFEFFNVFNDKKPNRETGFDIVIGNPPYGDLLSEKEKLLISSYQTTDLGEVSANFLERQISLLKSGGFFGNIIVLKVAYASRFMPLRELLRSSFQISEIICFERRPSQIFKDAQIQVGILIGNRGDSPCTGTIQTSRFIRLNEGEMANLSDVLENIEFHDTKGFVLGDRIGGACDGYEILPKIGSNMSASILRNLRSLSHRTVDDCTSENGRYVLYRIRGAGYHPTCMLEELYKSRTVQPISFKRKIERDFVFLAVNSQLFYIYWMIYSNARHLNTGIIKRFPIPPLEKIEKQRRRIYEMSRSLWKNMKNVFDPEKHYIYVASLRSLNDDVVDFLADFYRLNRRQVTYIKDYDSRYIW